MKEEYVGLTQVTPTEQSDVMIRLKVLAGEIYKERVYADYILRQMFPSTAEGTYLDMHAQERGLTRREGVKAFGSVYFFAADEDHGEIYIPEGTIVCTNNDMHRFVTVTENFINEGENGVSAFIRAVAPGEEYNAMPGSVTIIVTPVTGVGSVYNGSWVNGGADTESDDDLRARLLDSYVNISNGVNAAYYKRLVMSVDGVKSAAVIGCNRGAGTVDVFVMGDGARLTASKLNEVQEVLSEGRELNVDVQARHPQEIFVSLDIRLKIEPGYSILTVSNEVRTKVTDFIDHLGVGRDVKLSEVGEVIYHIKGVSDYKFVESYGSDVEIANSQFASSDSIIVREA